MAGSCDRGDGSGREPKIVAATFRHDTLPNLDPQLHTHAVVANMVQRGDGKWRTMVDDGLFNGKMAIRAIYRAELAAGFRDLGYGIEHTHADGRFEIEAAMTERGVGESKDNPHLAAKAALLTRPAKRDIDRDALERGWKRQAVFGHADLLAATLSRRPPPPAPFRPASPPRPR